MTFIGGTANSGEFAFLRMDRNVNNNNRQSAPRNSVVPTRAIVHEAAGNHVYGAALIVIISQYR